MFSLVVLASLIAVSVALPGYGYGSYGAGYGYGSGYGYHDVHHLPTAVSHQSRVDVHSKPIITPIVAHAPIIEAHHAPVAVVAKPYYRHVPAATSHQSRVDYISKPIAVATYVKPAIYAEPAHYYGGHYEPYASSLLHGDHYGSDYGYGHGLEYGHGHGHGYGYGHY